MAGRKDDLLSAIEIAVRGDMSNKREIAGSLLKSAIKRLTRVNGIDFNRETVTFSLITGQIVYKIGKDLFKNKGGIWTIEEVYRTDTPSWQVNVVGKTEFNCDARGSTMTGAPLSMTIHSSAKKLEVWPEPDSPYSLSGIIVKRLNNLVDIPEEYDDVLLHMAIESYHATQSVVLAEKLARQGRAEVADDSDTKWMGSQIPLRRNIGEQDSRPGVDSGNLRPL